MAIASQSVMKFSSIAHVTYLKRSELNDLKITIISYFASFISAIPMRLIAIFQITFKLFWICSSLLLNYWGLVKKRKQRNKIFQFTIAENSQLFITQCISFYIECYHQCAFISQYFSQIASLLFALNRYSNSLDMNLRITLEDVFTFIHTSIESRILLSALFQFPDEYKNIILLIANSCTVVTLDLLIQFSLTFISIIKELIFTRSS